jgi:hypothetical protein
MRVKGVVLFLFGLVLCLLTGCAQAIIPDRSEPEATLPVESISPPTFQPNSSLNASLSEMPTPQTQVLRVTEMKNTSSEASFDPALQPLVEQAMQDLALRLEIPVEQINLLEVRQVNWPDSSLGCPQPGTAYTQAPQEGLLIRLGVGREMYFYHSGENQIPFLCEGTSQVLPKVTPKDDEFVPPPDSEID